MRDSNQESLEGFTQRRDADDRKVTGDRSEEPRGGEAGRMVPKGAC